MRRSMQGVPERVTVGESLRHDGFTLPQERVSRVRTRRPSSASQLLEHVLNLAFVLVGGFDAHVFSAAPLLASADTSCSSRVVVSAASALPYRPQ